MISDNDINAISQRIPFRQYLCLKQFLCFLCLFVVLGLQTVNSKALGATQSELPNQSGFELFISQDQMENMIKRLQQGLLSLDYYSGPITGTVTPETDKAIRLYQRQNNMEQTGIVNAALLDKIETMAGINALLDKLSITKQVHTDAARQALLDNPSTRDLLTAEIVDEAADANRDPSLCYEKPTVRCLLVEALENAKTVNRSEMRNWVFGEILVAQARVGMSDAARDTTRRIKDPRLIMTALGEIAKAQALSGNHGNAIAAATVIPDTAERAKTLVILAEIFMDQGNKSDAVVAIDNLEMNNTIPNTDPNTDSNTSPTTIDIKSLGLLARASVVLFKAGETDRADALRVHLKTQSTQYTSVPNADTAMRHIASAMASIGDLVGALNLLDQVSNASEKMPVLMQTAEAQALAGDMLAATQTAQSIEALRYRAIILSTIAAELARTGEQSKALEIMDMAIETRQGIQYPFARDYAASRIALAFGAIASAHGSAEADSEIMNKAMEMIGKIEDQQLRAKSYWMLAFNNFDLERPKDTTLSHIKNSALAATRNIDSMTNQAWLLADLAEERAKLGNHKWAEELYEMSLTIVQTIKNAWGRARVLAKLSQALMAIAEMPASQESEQ